MPAAAMQTDRLDVETAWELANWYARWAAGTSGSARVAMQQREITALKQVFAKASTQDPRRVQASEPLEKILGEDLIVLKGDQDVVVGAELVLEVIVGEARWMISHQELFGIRRHFDEARLRCDGGDGGDGDRDDRPGVRRDGLAPTRKKIIDPAPSRRKEGVGLAHGTRV